MSYFDIAASNPERARKFYEKLFGWKFELLPGPFKRYRIETSAEDGKREIGGLARRTSPSEFITTFVGVDSVDKYLEVVEKLGGSVVEPKTKVSNSGFFAVFTDTEQNVMGLWETGDEAGH